MIEIDGSYLEGGGQIVRTAVGLAAATGQDCRIVSIRKGRPKPGLAAQHLCGVRAVAQTCGAELTGDALASTALTFRPGPLDPPDEIDVKVGTAGAVTLVLQALMVPLAVSERPVKVTVSGGTHVKWAPTIDYFVSVFAWYLGRMGVGIEVLGGRAGFYPKGGGQIRLAVTPGELKPLNLGRPEGEPRIVARSIATHDLANAKVAERQLAGAVGVLPIDPAAYDYVESPSTGTAIHLTAEFADCRLGASALGARGKRAEVVGGGAAREVDRARKTGACLDEHMADQVLPYVALSGACGSISVAEWSDHCRTSAAIVERMLPVRFEVDEGAGIVRCRPQE